MALALAGQRQHRAAEELAREAAALPPVEMLALRAELRTNLAEVLLTGGHRKEAHDAATEAAVMHDLKGNEIAAAWCAAALKTITITPTETSLPRAFLHQKPAKQ